MGPGQCIDEPSIDADVTLSIPPDVQQDIATHDEMLMRRSDDTPERYQHRLKRYAENIVALRNFYKAFPYTALDGGKSATEVLACAYHVVSTSEEEAHIHSAAPDDINVYFNGSQVLFR